VCVQGCVSVCVYVRGAGGGRGRRGRGRGRGWYLLLLVFFVLVSHDGWLAGWVAKEGGRESVGVDGCRWMGGENLRVLIINIFLCVT
jgi:hypothetical protein